MFKRNRLASMGAGVVLLAVMFAGTAVMFTGTASASSAVTLGPQGIQTLVSAQLFNRGGRWYLLDDGGVCFTYLSAPRTHLDSDRLVLNAHLTSRLGRRMGANCVGADLASNVTLSGRLRAGDHTLVFDDIRIDRVEDDSTRAALGLALQFAPDTIPHSVKIDVLELLRRQVAPGGAPAVRVDQFHIVSITTRPSGVAIAFDLALSSP